MTHEKTWAWLAACALTLGGLAIAAPAVAKDTKPIVVKGPAIHSDLPTRRVSYRDLNLASLDGERTLVRRVDYAVGDVCLESTGPMASFVAGWDCRSSAWRGARPQIRQAVRRAREIASVGWSAIAPVAITISVR